jgi:histidine triad (HIT) family protein
VASEFTGPDQSAPLAASRRREPTSTDPEFDAACLFCRIVAGRIPASVVRETDDTLAFRDINPQAPTHVIVIPKAHGYRNIGELARRNPPLAAVLLAEGTEVAHEQGLAEHEELPGYRFVFNTGAVAGQSVYHVHLHVLGGDALGRFGSARY